MFYIVHLHVIKLLKVSILGVNIFMNRALTLKSLAVIFSPWTLLRLYNVKSGALQEFKHNFLLVDYFGKLKTLIWLCKRSNNC